MASGTVYCKRGTVFQLVGKLGPGPRVGHAWCTWWQGDSPHSYYTRGSGGIVDAEFAQMVGK